MLYKFNVDKLDLECANPNKIILSDSIEYHIAKFEFDDTWNNYTKIAHFTNKTTNKSVQMVLDNKNSCYIPFEVLETIKDKGFLIVAIQGIGIENEDSEIWTKMKLPLILIKSDKVKSDNPSRPHSNDN